MFDKLAELYQFDWRIFMAGTEAWLRGGNPYGALPGDLEAGSFAYPPTALPWLTLFVPLGVLGFYVWTALQLGLWWRLIKDDQPQQLLLLAWAPMVLHLVEGQSSLMMVLILWAALRAPRRGWLWGLAIALALTKFQVVLLPTLWLLWQDRRAPDRWRLVGGILLGTALLALPATLRDPGIWGDWLRSLADYQERLLYRAAWQGFSVLLLALAGWLWYRSRRGEWHWWLTAALFPHTSFYGIVALLPAITPTRSRWSLVGLGLAGVLQGPINSATLPWILAGHILAAWLIAGGPSLLKAKAEAAPAAQPG
ncbi:MAG TPA: hypothetical protein VGE07_02040 [Herpetosiphonaceae bacterium]